MGAAKAAYVGAGIRLPRTIYHLKKPHDGHQNPRAR
jgi:hypothetical protein